LAVDFPPSPTLGQLAALPLDARFETLLHICRSGIVDAIAELEAFEPGVTRALTVERIAWAVAFNVAWTPEEAAAEASRVAEAAERAASRSAKEGPRKKAKIPATDVSAVAEGEEPEDSRVSRRGPRPTWSMTPGLDTPWRQVWSKLLEPPSGPSDRLTDLAQLAWVVACEQRVDWQLPAALPLDVEAADRAFETVYQRYDAPLRAVAFRRFQGRLRDVDAVVPQVWTEFVRGYVGAGAWKRYLANQDLFAFLATMCRNIGEDMCRRERNVEGLTTMDADGSERERDDAPGLHVPETTTARLHDAALERGVRRCLESARVRGDITPRDLSICVAVWLEGEQGVTVAGWHGLDKSRIVQISKKAREKLRSCLAKLGFPDRHDA
jgi:hypothetical protein